MGIRQMIRPFASTQAARTLSVWTVLMVVAMVPCQAMNKPPAKKVHQPATATSTKTSKASVSPAKKGPPPVLNAEARKSIEISAQKLDPQTRLELNRLSESLHLEDRAVNHELRDDEDRKSTRLNSSH